MDTEFLAMSIPILMAVGAVPAAILFLGFLLSQLSER